MIKNRDYVKKEGTDVNGYKYTRTVRAPDQKAAAVAATRNGFIRPAPPRTPSIDDATPQLTGSGAITHTNSAGQLHRPNGLPAVEYANGQVEHWENGEMVSRSMPGLTHPNHVTCAMAQIYVKQPNGARKPVLVRSSTSGATLSLPGQQPEFDYRGVALDSQHDLNSALQYSADEFDAKFGHLREEYIPLGERFDEVIREGYNDNPPQLIHRPSTLGAGLDEDGLDRYGYDVSGYDKDGFDLHGYGRDGLHKVTGFDKDGFSADGYNSTGINRHGFDLKGRLVAVPVVQPVRPQPTNVGATDGVDRVRKRDQSKPPAGAPAGWVPPQL